jgi:hypothetical protein
MVGFRPTDRDSAQMAKFWPPSPKFDQLRSRRNYLDSNLYHRNPATMVGILPISDRISSLVIFMLFCINIFMLWIKIDFYNLIWLNESIKNIYDFSYASNTEKCFRRKVFSWKMIFLKIFYNEKHFTSKQTKYKWNLVLSHVPNLHRSRI